MQLALAIVASFAALGGFLFGYDLGLIGGAILVIRNEFGTSKVEDAFIVGAAKVGAFVGVFLGGAYMYRYGRKAAILADSIFFTIGPLVMASAMSVAMLVLGRFLVGMGIGFSAVVVPAYLGEVAQPSMRGSVVTLYELMLCVGMVLSSLADAALEGRAGSWRWMVGLPVIPGLALALAPLVLPESPRWLLMAGDMPSALAALHKLRSSQPQKDSAQSTQDVENELVQLWKSVELDQASCRRRTSTEAADLLHSREPPSVRVDSGLPSTQSSCVSRLPPLPSALSVQSVRNSGFETDPIVKSQIEVSTGGSMHENRAGRTRRSDSYVQLPELLQMEWQHQKVAEASGSDGNDLERLSRDSRVTEKEHVQLLSTCGALLDTSKRHSGGGGGVLRAACTPVDTGMHAMHALPTAHSPNAGVDPGYTHGAHALHAHRSESGLLPAVSSTPQPFCSHDMHAVHSGNVEPTLTLAASSHSNRNGCGTLTCLCLEGLCLRRRTHAAHAQAVPDATALGSSKGQYNMLTPMHLVMWHMLWDCQRLLVDAFTISICGNTRMHERHALSQEQKTDQESCSLNDRGSSCAAHGVHAWASDVDREDSLACPPGAHDVQRIAERQAIRIAVVLAFFNQISASTAIMNYAPVLLKDVGVASSELAMELSAIISCSKTVGIILGIFLIDRVGRRLLLVSGSAGCAACMFSLAAGVWFTSYIWTLTSICLYIFVFSTCWAGVFWVVCSEIFSMSIKSPAMSLATASLFLSGAVADFGFPMMLSGLQSGTFIIFGCLAALGGVYVYFAVPETKGLTLQEVQMVLQSRGGSCTRGMA